MSFWLHLAVAVSCAVTALGEVVLDPTKVEEQVSHTTFPSHCTSETWLRSVPTVFREVTDLSSCTVMQKFRAQACLVFLNRPRSVVPELPAPVDDEPAEHGILTCVTRGAMTGKQWESVICLFICYSPLLVFYDSEIGEAVFWAPASVCLFVEYEETIVLEEKTKDLECCPVGPSPNHHLIILKNLMFAVADFCVMVICGVDLADCWSRPSRD